MTSEPGIQGKPRRRATSLLAAAGLATIAAVLATAGPARACWSDYTSESEVLGVAADGWFATWEKRDSDASEEPDDAITLHDPDGDATEIVSLKRDSPDWRRLVWKHRVLRASGSPPRLAALSLGHLSVRQARAAVVAAMKLTPLVADPTRLRHVKSGVRCGSIERETKSGFVRIADVGEQNFMRQFCPPITLAGFTHPASQLVFVRRAWRWDEGSEHARGDTVEWYPAERIAGIELAVRGERALNAGKAAEARALLQKSVALAPSYFPARRALVVASAKVGSSWAELAKTLATPIPEDVSCIAWADHEGPETVPPAWLPWKEASRLSDADAGWPWLDCQLESQYFYAVDAKGDPVE